MSDNGLVIVGVGSSTNGGEAFRWTHGSGFEALGDLSGREFNSVVAMRCRLTDQ